MRLLFTGTTSFWLIILMVIAASAYTVLMYRRHNLPKPWSFWLPALRVTSLILLILTLLQPVLSKVWNVNIRGRIPIVVDNSGSMSITDTYTPADIVNIGWNFNLYPKKLRNTVFTDDKLKLEEIIHKLREISGSKSNPGRYAVNDLEKKLSQISEDIDRNVKNCDYITVFYKNKKQGGVIKKYLDRGVSMRKYEHCSVNSIREFREFLQKKGRKCNKIIPLETLELKPNSGENYGVVIKGILTPPVTGTYFFNVAADDYLEFFISSNASPKNKKLIASVKTWTGFRKFTLHPYQKSKPVILKADHEYYFEMFFKECTGDDHFSVYWTLPGGRKPVMISPNFIRDYRAGGEDADFREKHYEFKKAFSKVQSKLKHIENLLKIKKNLKHNIDAVRKIMKETVTDLQRLDTKLAGLQISADYILGVSDNRKIAECAEKLKKMNRTQIVEFLLRKKPFDMISKLESIGDIEIILLNQPLKSIKKDEPLPVTGFLPTTRIGSVLYDVANRYGKQPVSGIFLFSDGQNNSGKSLSEIREVLSEHKIPLFSVGIGQKKPPKDIAVEKVFSPVSSYKKDKLNIQVLLHRNGFEDKEFKLTLKCKDKILNEVVVTPGSEPVLTVDMSFIEKESGLRHYQLYAQNMPGEILKNNNSKSFSVNILTDPVKVLLLEEFPRWESRYLNMMLKRDIRIKLDTVFIASSEDGHLKIKDEKGCFPASRNKLFAYDVIILGDVNPAHFRQMQLKNIHDFVVERGGVLIAMAGPNYMPEFYRNTPVSKLFPFKIQPKQLYKNEDSADNSTDDKVPIELNDLAMYDDIVKIGDTPESTLKLWKELPPMNWVKKGIYPSKNADVPVRTVKNSLPVILSAYAGLGKVLYIGTDSFWKWRKYVRWKYHHRMWGQIIMWATMGRTTGADKHVKLMTDRAVYSPDELITLKARVLDINEKAMDNATLSAEIYDIDGKMVKNVRFTALPDSGGEYRAKIKGLPKGKYKVHPQVLELADVKIKADYSFEVRDIATSEYINLVLNETALNSISNEYRFFTEAEKLIGKIPEINRVEHKREDYDLWDSFFLMLIATILLATEWQLRKKLKIV